MRLSSAKLRKAALITFAMFVCGFAAAKLHAELILETLVLELNDDDAGVEDVEVLNNGDERMFVSIEPARIESPGAKAQRITDADPERLGLLASPAKMILEPGQRRFIRVAAFSDIVEKEEVYRVLIRPVPAPDSPEETGLNVMVGYDLLVLVRPDVIERKLTGKIENGHLVVTNLGNSSVELLSGKQCLAGQKENCTPVDGKRLYAGQTWSLPLENDQPVKYFAKFANGVEEIEFSTL